MAVSNRWSLRAKGFFFIFISNFCGGSVCGQYEMEESLEDLFPSRISEKNT